MRKAGDIISGLFKQRFGEGFMENARLSSELFNSWEKTVCQVWPHGEDQRNDDIPAAAVHSRIRELERGVLFVEADHPGWIQILQTKQSELLLAIQRRCPKLDIRGIAFRLSREAVSPGQAGRKEPVETRSTEDVTTTAEGENNTKSLPAQKDEDFYAALKGLEESIKKRNN
jgi:hypothetical protein